MSMCSESWRSGSWPLQPEALLGSGSTQLSGLSVVPQKVLRKEKEGHVAEACSHQFVNNKESWQSSWLAALLQTMLTKEPESLWLPGPMVADLGSPAAAWGRGGKQSQKASSSPGRVSAGSPVSLTSWDTCTEGPSHLSKTKSKLFMSMGQKKVILPLLPGMKNLVKESQRQTAAAISTFCRSWSKCQPVNVSIPHIPYSQRGKIKKSSLGAGNL